MAKKITKEKKPKNTPETEVIARPKSDPVICPKGYYWNGSQCVADIG